MALKNVRQTCSICGQPAPVGGRLCTACRAALKRARDTTVSEAIAPPRTARKLPRFPVTAAAVPVDAPATTKARSGPRLSWAIGAACLVAVGIVWFIHSHDEAGAAASRAPDAERQDAAEAVPGEADDVPVPMTPLAVAVPDAGRPQAPASRERLDPRTMPSSIAVPRPAAKAPPAPPPEPPPDVAPVPELPPPMPPREVVAQAPPPKPPPDRWQQLAAKIEQCQGNVFVRTYCQESLRIEHCEGYWGRVAPCPAKAERLYGN